MFEKNSFPKIILISDKFVNHTYNGYEYEESKFDIKYFNNEYFALSFIKMHSDKINAIITCNNEGWEKFKHIATLPESIRCKWLHFNDYENHGNEIFNMVMRNSITHRTCPKISIFTSTYKTGNVLHDTYHSVVNQTFTDWEWIIVLDSNDAETNNIASMYAGGDPRIKLYSFSDKTNGNIGEAKYRAAMLCTGEWLLELDHDDMLLPTALETVLAAAKEFPESGFIYSDFIDIDENNKNIVEQYGKSYAFGYGKSYECELYFNGSINKYSCNTSPDINSATVRHIVGMPNHLRCWKTEIYKLAGSHNRSMRIADDYELCVRTFLITQFTHIQYPLYAQRFNNKNSQNENRGDIQRRVSYIAEAYNELINERFVNLQCPDPCYDNTIYRCYDINDTKSTFCIPCNKTYIVT